LKERRKEWYPKKRVQPAAIGSRKFKKVQIMRARLAEESHVAFKEAVDACDFSIFVNRMTHLIHQYRKLYKTPLWRRMAGTAKRCVLRLLGA
jgi:hypothetical protein